MRGTNKSMARHNQEMWEMDIKYFEDRKRLLKTLKSPQARALVIKGLNEVKDRYPSLKNEVIPTE